MAPLGQPFGALTLDFTASAAFHSVNDDHFGGRTLEQEPHCTEADTSAASRGAAPPVAESSTLCAMSTIRPPADPEADPRVKAVFDDIRATRKTDFVNNLWRALAFDAALLESTWAEVKRLMATASTLDPLTKEMIYIAVSVANACSYCVHSHTAAARAQGMTDAQHAELLAIVALAAKTNHLVTALQVPVDEVFDAGASDRAGPSQGSATRLP